MRASTITPSKDLVGFARWVPNAKNAFFENGRVFGVAALTAPTSIKDSLQVRDGETVLFEGAAGVMGGFAVQTARNRGPGVFATAWQRNHDYALSLGVDHVVDPGIAGVDDLRSRCDAVLQAISGPATPGAFDALKPGGRATFPASRPSVPSAPSPLHTSLRRNIERFRSNLDRLAAALCEGEPARSEIHVLSLVEGREAFVKDSLRHRKDRTAMSVPR